jgi:hypothetical protein
MFVAARILGMEKTRVTKTAWYKSGFVFKIGDFYRDDESNAWRLKDSAELFSGSQLFETLQEAEAKL